MKQITKYSNYIIIIVASIIAGFIPPMIGSIAGLAIVFPTTAAGWMLWSVIQICSAIANCLIFYAFISQGKDNVKDHPSYIKARELLRIHGIGKDVILVSPQEWERGEWRTKVIWLFIGTLLGGIALTQAILAFDVVRFICQLFAITFAILFGLIEMKKTEEMYSDYYLEYAEQQVSIKKEEELAAQTTNYLEITTTSTVERTREIPIKENSSGENEVSASARTELSPNRTEQ